MKWTFSQLQKYRDKGLVIDETFDASEITKIDQTIRDVSPVHITGRADIAPGRVTFHLKIEGEMILPCSRTLVDVKYPVNVETTEVFLMDGTDYHAEDEEIHLVKGELIDLGPVVREILLLEVPMQVISDNPAGESGAPQTGTDWAVVSEEEPVKKIDPRLAKLAKLLDQNEPQE